MAFDGLDISISGSSGDAKTAIASVKSSLAGLSREANDAQDSLEEVGDEATNTSSRLGPLAATAAASALSVSGLSSAAIGASSSLTALGASIAGVTVVLSGLVTVATPLLATLGGLVTAGASLAGVFGVLAGATVATRFGELKEALVTAREGVVEAVEPLAEALLPVLLGLIERLPAVAEAVVEALGPLEPFTDAVEDAGDAILNALPAIAEFAANLSREALPVLRDLVDEAGDAVPDAIRAMLEVTRELGPILLDVADAAADIVPVILEIGTEIVRRVAPAVSTLIDRAGDAVAVLREWGQSDQASDIIRQIRQEIVPLIPRVVDLAREFGPLLNALLDNLPQIIDLFGGFADSVLDIANTVIPVIVPPLTTLVDLLGDASGAIARWIERSDQGRDKISSDALFLKSTYQEVASTITEAWSYLTGTGEGSLYGDVRAGFERLRNYFASTFHLGALENAFNAAVSGIGDAFDRLNFSGFENALDSVAGGVRSLITSLNDLAGVDIDVDVPTFDDLLDEARSIVDPAPEPEPEPDPGAGDDGDDNTTGDVDPGGQNPDERDGVGDDRQGVDDDPAGTVGAGGTDAHTGGFIASGGPVTLAAGERVLPAGQVTDRGRAELAPSSVADGFDESATGTAIVSELRQLRQAVESDASVSDRDLVRGLERLFDRHNGSL